MSDGIRSTLSELAADPEVAGIRLEATYEATTQTVTPPAGSYRDSTGVIGEFQLPEGRTAATIDSWGSQFSRMEALIPEVADRIGFPLVIFSIGGGKHVTTSTALSHRQADATWRLGRDELEAAGVPFDRIQDATVRDALPLLRWFPTAVIGGFWHSHSTPNLAEKRKKGTADKDAAALASALKDQRTAELLDHFQKPLGDARMSRLFVSEIIAEGVSERRRHAGRVDSLFGPVGGLPGAAGATGAKRASNLGIGSLPPVRHANAPSDLTYEELRGTAFLSLATLRRYSFDDASTGEHVEDQVARPLIMALTLYLYLQLQHHLDLRSGAELVLKAPGVRATVQRHGKEPEILELPTLPELEAVVRALGQEAGWQGPIAVDFPATSPLARLLDGFEGADDGATSTDL